MRSLLVVSLLSLSPALLAQQPVDAKGQPQAAATADAGEAKYKELEAAHRERMGKAGRDQAAREEVVKARTADLEAFLEKFPTGASANRALIELARTSKEKEKVPAYLGKLDNAALDMDTALAAAATAKDNDDLKQQFLGIAKTKATNVEQRLKLASAMRGRMLQDAAGADALMAEIEKSATTDEDKAMIAMHRAVEAKHAKQNDKYTAALKEISTKYPNTKSGKMATARLAAAEMKVGSDPVPFIATDMDGKEVKPSDYKGKVLLIDFWATWCGPCMAELPHLLETYQAHHAEGFEILGISLDRATDKDRLVSTIKEKGMSWRHVYDGRWWEAEVAQMYEINSIPATILIGRDGKVAATNLRGAKLEEAVKAALAAK